MDHASDRPSRYFKHLATYELGIVRPSDSPGLVSLYVSGTDTEKVIPYMWRLNGDGALEESQLGDLLAVLAGDLTDVLMTRLQIQQELFRSVERH